MAGSLVRIPLGQSQSIPTTGGQLQFFLKNVTARLGRANLHVAVVELDMSLKIVSAATSDAVKGSDFPFFIKAVDIQRTPDKPIMSAMPGSAINVLNALTNQGIVRGVFPTNIGANASTTTTAAWQLPICFDQPFGASDRYEHCWPVAAFKPRGKINVTFANPASDLPNITSGTAPAGLTFAAGGTCDINLWCIPRDDVHYPPDVRYEMIDSTDTATKKGYVVPEGTYRYLVYAPTKFGGTLTGDATNLANVTIDGSPYQQANLFPSIVATRHNVAYQYTNVADLADASTKNMIVQNAIAVLWAPGFQHENTKSVFVAPEDFKLDAILSTGAMLNGHRFIYGRVFPVNVEDHAKAAASAGLNPATVRKASTRLDHSRAIDPARRRLIGTRIAGAPNLTAR